MLNYDPIENLSKLDRFGDVIFVARVRRNFAVNAVALNDWVGETSPSLGEALFWRGFDREGWGIVMGTCIVAVIKQGFFDSFWPLHWGIGGGERGFARLLFPPPPSV